MQRAVLTADPHADLSVSLVWINMRFGDTATEAAKRAHEISEPRVHHFYDPSRRAGEVMAQSLGAPGKTAWDIYLVFERASEWKDDPPVPSAWTHQLYKSSWADPARYRRGSSLLEELHFLIRAALEVPGSRG